MHLLVSGQAVAKAEPPWRKELPAGFVAGWDAIVADYLHIKDALVADNTWGAAMAAGRLLGRLHAVDHTSLTRTRLLDWACMRHALRSAGDQIAGASAIELQRKYFVVLSRAMLAGVSKIGAGDHHLYQLYCPMADGGRGASWLSLHPAIQNPYFGEAMLRCGRVAHQLPGRGAAPALADGFLPGRLTTPVMHGCHGPGR